ncbi:hypothetical protein CHS0354_028683 [Potamilus streckersoni]|uniref:tRNA-splicing endonuclease subunit Sen54 N-terminal domain-containing protein n=1 Tax=Potamilus streckersoni TaxID=2493646 RepID=A0AAE0SW52_9BIVA|nr:hypothetical protein CHS0354_028683 [Potamilus streckersoni]
MHTSLSGEKLFRFRTPLDKSLPQKGGIKDFAPDGSWLQAKKLEKFYEERLQALSEPRVEKSSDLVKGEWNPEKCLVEFEKEKGKFWIHMGFVDVKRKWLYPEEALFLMETSVLEVWYRGLPISLQQAYTFFLVGSLSMEQYQVYLHLRRIGYVVLRHQGRLNFTRYEKQLGLDKYANKKQRKRKQNEKQENPSDKKSEEQISSEMFIPTKSEEADTAAENFNVSARKKHKILIDLPCAKDHSKENSFRMDASVTVDTYVTMETNGSKYKCLQNDKGIDESVDITSCNGNGDKINESNSCSSLDGESHDSVNTSQNNKVCAEFGANRHKCLEMDDECSETINIAISLSKDGKGLTSGLIDQEEPICDTSAAEVKCKHPDESPKSHSMENFQKHLEESDLLDTHSGKLAPVCRVRNHQGWYTSDDLNEWYNLICYNAANNQNLQMVEPDNSLQVVFESDLNQNLHRNVIFPDIGEKDMLVLRRPDDRLLPENITLSDSSLIFNVQNYHKTKSKTRDSRREQNIPYLYELDFSYAGFMRSKFRGQARSWKEYRECVKREEFDASGSTPVQYLWQESEEVVPLVRPENAVSTAAVLQKLQIIQEVDVTKMCKWPNNKEKISYDVYLPDLKFKKSQPGIPNHRICVVRSVDPPPSISEVSALYGYLDDDIPIHWAVVDNGEIAFYEFSPISLPVDITVG